MSGDGQAVKMCRLCRLRHLCRRWQRQPPNAQTCDSKEGGKWKVSHCSTPPAGVRGARPELPAESAIRELATRTLVNFNDALRRQDFPAFLQSDCADPFQREHPADDMKPAFQAFIDKKADIAGVAAVAAVLDPPPSIDERNSIMTAGHYPTRPMNVHFALRYLREGEAWRVAAIDVSLKRAQ